MAYWFIQICLSSNINYTGKFVSDISDQSVMYGFPMLLLLTISLRFYCLECLDFGVRSDFTLHSSCGAEIIFLPASETKGAE